MAVSERRKFVMVQSFDLAYVDRLRDRDPETEQHFISYFSDLIRIKLRARLRSWQLAEDVMQETFLRVFRALESPRGIRRPEGLGAFVSSVCNNVLAEFLRAQGRHPVASTDALATLLCDADGPHDDFVTEERKAEVRHILDDLPARDRHVLEAIFLEDRDREEVCARLGVGRTYLRVLLHRAKTEFRNGFLKRQAILGLDRSGARLSTASKGV